MATLAVFIALGGGAYAVTKVGKNSVTSKSIKDGAVKSADVLNDGLTGTDIDESTLLGMLGAQGAQGPPGPTAAGVTDHADPVANPDNLGGVGPSATVSTPTSGRLLVTFVAVGPLGVTVFCNAGNPNIGLYVDGVPVPDTRVSLSNNTLTDVSLAGITATAVPPGNHPIVLGEDCPSGSFSGASLPGGSVVGVLLGG
jgi:hypothetical protein